jgi:hypothetical protein
MCRNSSLPVRSSSSRDTTRAEKDVEMDSSESGSGFFSDVDSAETHTQRLEQRPPSSLRTPKARRQEDKRPKADWEEGTGAWRTTWFPMPGVVELGTQPRT